MATDKNVREEAEQKWDVYPGLNRGICNPMGRMDAFIDGNVRRTNARFAGIHTCSDPDHKTCMADTEQGVTRGIHNSWHDLQQIKIPDCMARLEKMQCEYDMGVLSKATRAAIAAEVQRLESRRILMNLGTLTQETLRSKPAKRKLIMRGLDAVSEKRLRGHDEADNPRLVQMLVPSTRFADTVGCHPVQSLYAMAAVREVISVILRLRSG